MKKITLLSFILISLSFNGLINAQETCASSSTFTYYTTNVGWSSSEFYKILDIDAEKLTDANLPKHSGENGSNTSTNFGTGSFTSPIYTWNETTELFEPSNVMWPVKYYMACFAPNFLNSASTKVNELGTAPSKGSPAECTNNNNSVLTSPIWNKKGFIELSRQASDASSATTSRHGYLEIDNLPMVERVQWSFSSTGYKRGVKLDINYNEGNGWESLQWEPSNLNNFVTFAEQGYQFENLIGKGGDETSKISLRWHIWDGDSIHNNPMTETPFTTTHLPYAAQQVVRIHQIVIYSGTVPDTAPSGLRNNYAANIKIYLSGKTIKLSEESAVNIFTVEGKPVFNGLTETIDVSNFSKGIYIVKAINKEGKIQNTKIIL